MKQITHNIEDNAGKEELSVSNPDASESSSTSVKSSSSSAWISVAMTSIFKVAYEEYPVASL